VIRYAIESLRSLVKSERGQDLVEYALLTGGIAIGLIVAVGAFSGALAVWFGDLKTWVEGLSP
jgi:Flp pilus assembly pilin Flp